MMVVDLDKLEIGNERQIKLNGKVHNMAPLTVKDYIFQLKKTEQIQKLQQNTEMSDVDILSKAMEISIDAILQSFPTLSREDVESLKLPQMAAIRDAISSVGDDEINSGAPGESQAGE